MTFVELPVVPIYWHFPRTIKGYIHYSYNFFYLCRRLPVHTFIAVSVIKDYRIEEGQPTLLIPTSYHKWAFSVLVDFESWSRLALMPEHCRNQLALYRALHHVTPFSMVPS